MHRRHLSRALHLRPDKANTRVARIRCDIIETDKIVEIPNTSDTHGLRPQKYPRTGHVFAHGGHRVPLPNDGSVHDDPTRNRSLFTAIDGDTMDVVWQIIVDGNLDNRDADCDGKYAVSTCYNSEDGGTLAEMTANETDRVVVFNLKRIEAGIAAGDVTEYRGVKVLDGRHGSKHTAYIPVPTARTAATWRPTRSTSAATASSGRP